MEITPEAAAALRKLVGRLEQPNAGLRFAGSLGTCRGSAPILQPAPAPLANETEVVVAGIRFFVPDSQRQRFALAKLDRDGSLLGKGLTLTWPHQDGCACQRP